MPTKNHKKGNKRRSNFHAGGNNMHLSICGGNKLSGLPPTTNVSAATHIAYNVGNPQHHALVNLFPKCCDLLKQGLKPKPNACPWGCAKQYLLNPMCRNIKHLNADTVSRSLGAAEVSETHPHSYTSGDDPNSCSPGHCEIGCCCPASWNDAINDIYVCAQKTITYDGPTWWAGHPGGDPGYCWKGYGACGTESGTCDMNDKMDAAQTACGNVTGNRGSGFWCVNIVPKTDEDHIPTQNICQCGKNVPNGRLQSDNLLEGRCQRQGQKNVG